MTNEVKEWKTGVRRSGTTKSGGIHVYIDSDVLEFSGLSKKGEIEYKLYPCSNGRVIIKFRRKQLNEL